MSLPVACRFQPIEGSAASLRSSSMLMGDCDLPEAVQEQESRGLVCVFTYTSLYVCILRSRSILMRNCDLTEAVQEEESREMVLYVYVIVYMYLEIKLDVDG